MKKVGMITIYRKNYGAFFQAYALQQELIKLGYSPELIRYDYYRDHTLFGVPTASRQFLKKMVKAAIVETIRYLPHKRRQAVFDKSIQENLRESKEYYRTYEALVKNPPQYDLYLTGSDQVFNIALSPQAAPARLLRFVRNGKKASYAASAGNSRVDETFAQEVVEALKTFDGLSVREERLANSLRTEFGLPASQHIDPVFLMEKAQWDGFAKKLEGLPEQYIFYYRVLPQNKLNETAERLSSETQLPVFVADGHDKFSNQVPRHGFLSPEQWVYALSNASYVVTNSFHGAAFAVNLKKQARILVPPKGGERVCALMEKCGIAPGQTVSEPIQYAPEHFNAAQRYILGERVRSAEYLRSLLD